MAITTDLATAIGQVRAELGDDTADAGVLPGDANLSDAQIDYLLTREGSVGRATAGGAALVSRRWARAISTAAGPLRQEFQQIYEHWAAQAASLRAQYGYGADATGAAAGTSFSAAPCRSDGYSTGTGAEYTRWPEHEL